MGVRGIIHLDLDAFYASVEQLRRPELRGRPVIVGGADSGNGRAVIGRGVVSAASYEARVYGVHSAMPLATALRLCPHAAVVPVDFTAYRTASQSVFGIAREYTPLIEPLSLDEAFLDVTDSERRFGSARDIAARIRERVLELCSLHASFGVATCKTVAKVASDLRKPQGFVVVEPGDEAAFLAPLPLRRLPGLGPATETTLTGLGIHTLGELAGLPLETVQRRVGVAHGRSLWERAQGIDSSAVAVPGRPQSVSREETFSSDITDREALVQRIATLSADVAARLRAGKWTGRTVTLKLRYGDFTTITRQHSVEAATDSDVVIRDAATALFDIAWSKTRVRLLGVGVSGLEDASQLDLFVAPAQSRLDHTLDTLRKRFGRNAIHRGAGEKLRDMDWRSDDLRSVSHDDD
ncbi:MAG: DNA polymerase IV [Candidatus Dormibacteraeota bacterium]|nr:DNA polymerase IV [Candidatus Dormibacteraeota bacterium]